MQGGSKAPAPAQSMESLRTERSALLLGFLFSPFLLFPLWLPSSLPPLRHPSLSLPSFTAMLEPADIGTRLFFPPGIRVQCRAENLTPTSAVRSTARLKFQQTKQQQYTVTLCHRWKGKCLCPYTHTPELFLWPQHGLHPDKHKQKYAAVSGAAQARHTQGSHSAQQHRPVQRPQTDTQTPGSSPGDPRHTVGQTIPPLNQKTNLTQRRCQQKTKGGEHTI